MFDLYRLLTVIINFFPCFINDVTAADIEIERISSNFLWNLPHYYGRIFCRNGHSRILHTLYNLNDMV